MSEQNQNPDGPVVEHRRTIHSFVRRNGRLTTGQRQAMQEWWPVYGIEFEKTPLDFPAIFGSPGAVSLEIGFGNGTSLATMAAADRSRHFIGIEVYQAGVGQLLGSIVENQLDNLRIIHHDAIEVLTEMIPLASLDCVQLFFPDPWPKKRHFKRRIVNTAFLDLIAGRLLPGGIFHMATDWEHYALEALERLQAHPEFANTAGQNGFAPRPESRPVTKFERRGKRLDHGVWDLIFKCNQ